MIANELHEELNNLFNTLREDGMTAIALCENEGARTKLLGLMQYATRQEVVLKKLISDVEDTVIITTDDNISEDQLNDSGETVRVIKIDIND